MSEPERRWRVYRVTIDTNIFVSLVIQRRLLTNPLLALWSDGRFVLILSQAIVDEIETTLLRLRLERRYSYTPRLVRRLVNLLGQEATFVEPPFSYGLCRQRDMDDDPVADCAIWGRAQFLVSEDNDFLEDPTIRQALFEFGVEVIDSHAFVERIQE